MRERLIKQQKTKRTVYVGGIAIGGDHPVVVQSMTKTKTSDIRKTISQITRLSHAGCEIVRLAVVNKNDAAALKAIKGKVSVPLVADIHFDYRLAIAAIDAGVDKIRINPGNIGERWKVEEVIRKARDHNVPIRIGINAGSLPEKILRRYRRPTPQAIVAVLNDFIEIFEKNAFKDIVISAKCADVLDTVKTYQAISRDFEYPLHLGVTEAGLAFEGSIRSAVGLGILLCQGIGDTIRVSLADDPVKEVVAGFEILNALSMRITAPRLTVCPTCGRCEVDLLKIAKQVQERLRHFHEPLKIAVMGCVVNGPGEARMADFGIACGKKVGVVFARGKEVRRVKEPGLVTALFEEINAHINNR